MSSTKIILWWLHYIDKNNLIHYAVKNYVILAISSEGNIRSKSNPSNVSPIGRGLRLSAGTLSAMPG